MQTSQGYIFRIFQDFATKFLNFTTFERFFPGITLLLSRSKLVYNANCPLNLLRDQTKFGNTNEDSLTFELPSKQAEGKVCMIEAHSETRMYFMQIEHENAENRQCIECNRQCIVL